MRLPEDVKDIIESHVGAAVEEADSIGGGCISNAVHIRSTAGDYFAKWSRGEAAHTFPSEAASLSVMRSANSTLVVPSPLLALDASDGSPGVLLTEWIETGSTDGDFWALFGQALADLHESTADQYGFDTNNFIGRLPQDNKWEETWVDFFRLRRLEPQAARARRNRRWNASWDAPLDRLYARLEEMLPMRPEASLLHGDLWSGNYMVNSSGQPVVIDPASYYGHRETDLAMTELFGGFDRQFYKSYREAWPVERGYEERREIYNLYHLINHLNHFGSAYSGPIERILRRY